MRTVVHELGGDADLIARRAGLPLGALDEDELLIQDSAIAAVLELAARELACADFGLRVALRQDLGMLGPLAVALQNSPTAAEALDCTSRYLFVHARSLSVRLVPDPKMVRGVVGVRYGYTEPVKVPPQSADMGLLFLHRALLYLLGGSYGLRTVEVPHRPGALLAAVQGDVRPVAPGVPPGCSPPPGVGADSLREAIAEYAQQYKHVKTNRNEVVVVPGGKPVMFFTMLMLVEPGDEVIYPNPSFPIYESCIKFAGGVPVPMPLTAQNDFRIDLEQFRQPAETLPHQAAADRLLLTH